MSIVTRTYTAHYYQCTRKGCGHQWQRKGARHPRVCPKCKYGQLDATRRDGKTGRPKSIGDPTHAVQYYKCEKQSCGHQWRPKGKSYPRICPKCKSDRWDASRGDEKPVLINKAVTELAEAAPKATPPTKDT